MRFPFEAVTWYDNGVIQISFIVENRTPATPPPDKRDRSAIGRPSRDGRDVALDPGILISADDHTWYVRVGEEDTR